MKYKPYNVKFSVQRGFTLIEGIIATAIISTALIAGLALAFANLQAARSNSDRVLAGQLAREGLEVVRHIRDSNWLRFNANIDCMPETNDPSGTQFCAFDDFFYYDATADVTKYVGPYFDIVYDFTYNVAPASPDMPYTLIPSNYVIDPAATPDFYYSIEGCTAENFDTDMPPVEDNAWQCRIRKNNGIYYQNANDFAASPPGEELTNFTRRISLKGICWNGSTESVQEVAQSDAVTKQVICSAGTLTGLLVSSEVMWADRGEVHKIEMKERMYDWR